MKRCTNVMYVYCMCLQRSNGTLQNKQTLQVMLCFVTYSEKKGSGNHPLFESVKILAAAKSQFQPMHNP